MEIPIDYHILFLMMTFILFILTIILLFVDNTFEKTIAAMVLAVFNMVLCIFNALSFYAIDLYGHSGSGVLEHNVYYDLYPLGFLYLGLFYINFMLTIYCGYLFLRKPMEDHYGKDEVFDRSETY